VFRPDDGRLDAAAELIRSLGAEPLCDALLAVESTDAAPKTETDYVVLTSKTGVELAAEAGWSPGDAVVCAIGESTADALRTAGYRVDRVPDTFSSSGLVESLRAEIDGATVEVARSDHGSPVLTDGLAEAGADVHETVLYRLVRPPESGESAAAAARGDLAAALFTSSLTVEHFLGAAADQDILDAARDGLNEAVVGAIGEPTRETAENAGIAVDVVPERAAFDALACAVVEDAAPSYWE
jgi:uroporphyrinogen-III synthase